MFAFVVGAGRCVKGRDRRVGLDRLSGQKAGTPFKPDPSVVFGILGKCPTPKTDVLYVGDSGIDMETARRACVESAGVSWGFRPLSELRANYADHIATTTDDLLNLAL